MKIFNNVTVIGLGLIGGSLARAIKQQKLACKVTGVDPNADNLRAAIEQGAVDEAGESIECAGSSDLIIIAAPVNATLRILKDIGPHLLSGTIITDVCSSKKQLMSFTSSVLPAGTCFIGGHPMTGSEKSGFTASSPYLFKNSYYVLVPAETSCSEAFDKMVSLVKGIGAVPVELSPELHDAAVAAVSHLPHLTAAALLNTLGTLSEFNTAYPLAAGGFSDTTRVASGDPWMWQEILLSNRKEIVNILNIFLNELQKYKAALENNDEESILEQLTLAREIRSRIKL
ncbi:MAG: prephenate dehydrogenase/arogenate dehydrogenase family protein [Clostridiales bacterium]|nr:prephenate dehydrogenase/arogenate dehydrogenase family protein [Clostridiales bacterium]MCF8023224.1 prephenate dehydrogenase/arogenate dehydrogenase family protein [Clostridiales bacterium]